MSSRPIIFSTRCLPATKGGSIFEAILGIAVFGLVAAGTVSLFFGPMTAADEAADRQRAAYLAEEGIEAARSVRNDGWANLTFGDHGLAKLERWHFSGLVEEIDGFTRVVNVAAVSRDVNGDIVISGGTPDPRTRKVTVTVSWTASAGFVRTVRSQTYLTDQNSYRWRQSTDLDFGSGAKNGTEVFGTGEAAVVQLSSGEQKTWTPREGKLTSHSSEEFWLSGTFTGTEMIGVGYDAAVRMTGDPEWVLIYAGKNFWQTTDAHFATGTFSNTVGVDTGDLGAVSLATTTGWSAMPSPVTHQMEGVYLVSSTFGFAVGDGGRIIRWDGSSWTVAASPTANHLFDVWCTSESACWAVGAGGVILRWNGAAWSTATSPVSNDLNAVSFVDAGNGWAVGASGKILRWNGTSWSQQTDTGNQSWNDVHMVSTSLGWTVTASGKIFRYNGTSWAEQADTGNQTWNSLWMTSSTNGFVVGGGGEIYRYNGTTWSNVASPTASALNCVGMSSPSSGFAVGAGGTIVKWNGTAWNLDTSPGGTQMNGVFQLGLSEAYAVGNGGVVWQYGGGHYVFSGTYLSRVFDAGAYVDWGRLFWDELLPEGTSLTIATRTGNTATPDGTWSGWSSEVTVPFGEQISSPDGRYLQFRATLTTDSAYFTPRLNSMNVTYSEPTAGSFFDQVITAVADGWAVGSVGAMARYDGENWSAYPSVVTDSLLGLDNIGTDKVWAVGDNGRIIYWNGVSWTTQVSGTTRTLYGVDAVSATSVYAVGGNGTFLHFDGAAWTSLASPTTKGINAVAMLSDTDGWAVGNNGGLYRWDGAAWSEVAFSTSNSLEGIFMLDSSFGVIVGAGGQVYHWDGANWNSVDSTTPNELRDVWCVSTEDCWAWGIEQTFLQWNGTVWSRYVFTNPSNPLIESGQMLSGSEGWAMGEGGAIYHYVPIFVSPSFWLSPVIDGGANGAVWNTIGWDSIEALGTSITVITRTGETPVPDGTWSSWSTPEYTDKGGSTITSPNGRYLQYEIIFNTSFPQNTATLTEVRVVSGAATGQALYDVDGTAIDDVWAVGRSGTIARYDGTAWSTAASPTNRNLNGLDALSLNEAYAVGDQGALVGWNGAAWSSLTSPTANDLYAVSMESSSLGFAVGASGTILQWSGGSWATFASPTGNTLRGVDLFDASNGFAVGDGGVILRWNGTAWSSVASPVVARLNAVHLLDASTGFAVGDGGVILRWNGTAWSSVASPVVANLYAVESRSASEAWGAGQFGIIVNWDGSSWSSFLSPTTRTLYGITVEAPTEGWICGEKGVLLKDPPVYFPIGEFLSSILDTDAGAVEWDSVYFTPVLPPNTVLTVALRSGDTASPDGSWSAWTAETGTSGGAAITCPAARYLQYRAVLQTFNTAVTPALDEINVIYRK